LEGFTFHLPTKGLSAAHEVPLTQQVTSNSQQIRFNISSSFNRFGYARTEPTAD
jgi:hypothetical protein